MNIGNLVKESWMRRKRWVSVYILLAAAILYFVYALGFMTNFYRLFYEGDSSTLDFLKELQLLNRFIFENALVTLVLSIFAIGLKIHARKTGIINALLLSGFLVYEINGLMTYLGAIPYYVTEYAAIDLSNIKNYNSSPFMLYLSYGFSIGIIVLLLITALQFALQMIKNQKARKGGIAQHEG